jgi:RimJ/RimL family protein N-acetyltransferase
LAAIVKLGDQFTQIVDACMLHRPWFDDYTWADEKGRRVAVVDYLRDAAQDGVLWTIWDGAKLVGVVLLNEVKVGLECYAHFIFFDRKLADKRYVCRDLMAWAFDKNTLNLHRISVEVPTYAYQLASWLRKKMGFRYETEGRSIEWPKELRKAQRANEIAQLLHEYNSVIAAWGSRRFEAMLYKGEWHDVLLLSLTQEEFYHGHVEAIDQKGRDQGGGLGEEDGVRTGELHGGSAGPVQGSGGLPERSAGSEQSAVPEVSPWGT